ncbi:MAG: tetratricopeptide repeat protein [Microcoleaceae cyanobacterium]
MSEDSPKRLAFLVNALTGEELKAVKRDVSTVHSILTNPEQGGCRTDGPAPIHECNSRTHFEEKLRNVLEDWYIKDQLVFYFSGHGDIRKNNQYCLQMGLKNADWYPFNNLMSDLSAVGVQRAIIIIDACHSGAVIPGTKNSSGSIYNIKESIEISHIPRGIAIITSSEKAQESHELSDGSSGVFTDLFCNAIQTNLGGEGTNDGYIYVKQIVEYINQNLQTHQKYSEFKLKQRSRLYVDKVEAEEKIWVAKCKKIEDSIQSNTKLSHSVRTLDDLKILYEQTHPNRHPCPEATTEDIDLEVLEKYANKVEPDLYKTAYLEEVLSKLKLYSPIQDGSRNVLHKSAVLCFHKRPEMIYPQARSVFVFGRPRESNFVRQDILGPLSFQVEALVEKVKKYSETRSYIAGDGLRREVEEIDLQVVRELISNAIAHRDYQLTGTVKVAITPEALEVYSPGRFSPELSWEQLIEGIAPVSSPVDEAISLYLLNLLVFEGIGRGFDVFKEYIKENGPDSIICKELPGPTTYIRVLRRANRTIIQGNNNIINLYNELPHGSSLPPNNVPRSSSTCFVGREKELESLHQELQRKDKLVVCAIVGMGGVGKTELALQYTYKYGQQYSGGICWVSSRGYPLNTGEQIVALAQAQLDLKPSKDLDLNTQVQYCWRNWKTGDVLVIFDDVTEYEYIEPYLPPANSRFKVVITTRKKGLSQSFRSLNLDVLDETAALELLTSYLSESRLQKEWEAARKLCRWLGFLPLALKLIGVYLSQRQDLSLEKMLSRLEFQRLELKALQSHPGTSSASASGIADAFELSWQELDKAEQELAFLLSIFALAPIPWSLVESCLSERESEELEAIRDETLLNLSLLQRTGEDSYQLHPLIREFISNKREQSEKAENLKSRYVRVLVAVAQTITENLTLDEIHTLAPNIPHLEEATTTLTNYLEKKNIVPAFTGLGRYYTSQGYYQQAQHCYEKCLEEVKLRSESNDSDIATALNNLADIYRIQGRYTEAETLFQEALQVWQELLGNQHPNVASGLNNLASLYSAQGRYAEAEPIYKEALDLRKRLLGNEHPNVALSLKNLAELYYYQGRYSAAKALYTEALEINKQLLRSDNPAVAQTLNDLASVYHSQERYTEAEPLYLEAIEINKRFFKSNHPSVAQTLNNLASLYYSQGRYAEAEPLYLEAIEIRQKLFGDRHPDIAQTLNNLASLYQRQERYDEAEPLFKKAIEVQRQVLGVHPSVCISLNNLANFYLSQGYHTEAEPLLQEAIELQRQLLGENHPDTAISLYNLASLYQSQGQYKEAKNLFQKALATFETTLGENHSNTVLTRGKLDKIQEEMRSENG